MVWGYSYGSPWPMMGTGLGIMGILFVFFIVLPPLTAAVCLVMFLRWIFKGRKGGRGGYYPGSEEEYMDILKTRYAKGDITKEQFEEMKKTLKNP